MVGVIFQTCSSLACLCRRRQEEPRDVSARDREHLRLKPTPCVSSNPTTEHHRWEKAKPPPGAILHPERLSCCMGSPDHPGNSSKNPLGLLIHGWSPQLGSRQSQNTERHIKGWPAWLGNGAATPCSLVFRDSIL